MNIFDAIQNNDLEEIKLLIADGINLEQRHYYSTPLDYAIGYHRAEIAKELLDAGAKIHATKSLEEITCQISCDEEPEEYHIYVLDILVQAGMNINTRLEDGDTILMTAALCGRSELVRRLVAAGADVNAVNKHGSYALRNAGSNRHLEVFDYLLPLTSLELRKIAIEELPPTFARQLREKRQRYENLKPDSSSATSPIAFLPEIYNENQEFN
jgi:ankyrin repeat protein